LLFSFIYVVVNLAVDLLTPCLTRGSAIERIYADEARPRRAPPSERPAEPKKRGKVMGFVYRHPTIVLGGSVVS